MGLKRESTFKVSQALRESDLTLRNLEAIIEITNLCDKTSCYVSLCFKQEKQTFHGTYPIG